VEGVKTTPQWVGWVETWRTPRLEVGWRAVGGRWGEALPIPDQLNTGKIESACSVQGFELAIPIPSRTSANKISSEARAPSSVMATVPAGGGSPTIVAVMKLPTLGFSSRLPASPTWITATTSGDRHLLRMVGHYCFHNKRTDRPDCPGLWTGRNLLTLQFHSAHKENRRHLCLTFFVL
jgi:hypothetical protein